jgi:polygalacturonase
MKNILYGFVLVSASVSGQSWPSALPQVQSVSFKADTFSILDYRAVPDGMTLNTEAMNAAIEACHGHGGGTVLVPDGFWLTGPIVLKSNVNLHLADGAVLQFSVGMESLMNGKLRITSTQPQHRPTGKN